LTWRAASHNPVGRVERASYLTPNDVAVSQRQHVSLVKFGHDDDLRSFAIKAPNVTAGEMAPGLTARVDLVASQVGTSPSCPTLTADQVQGEAHVYCTLPVRP
jgi:hypothetical protein